MGHTPGTVNQARILYIQHGKNILEIAAILGVNEKTIRTWKQKGGWDEQKDKYQRTGASNADWMIEQLQGLILDIRNKCSEENRAPTSGEADSISKLSKAVQALDSSEDIDRMRLVISQDMAEWLVIKYPGENEHALQKRIMMQEMLFSYLEDKKVR